MGKKSRRVGVKGTIREFGFGNFLFRPLMLLLLFLVFWRLLLFSSFGGGGSNEQPFIQTVSRQIESVRESEKTIKFLTVRFTFLIQLLENPGISQVDVL